MLVSVLIPVFEQAAFISRAIESALAQASVDVEAIVVDDGSRDGTSDVLRSYARDPRVRVIVRECNEGLGRALNTALDAASGQIVAYLPADDVYYDGHLRSLVDALAADSCAVLAFSGVTHHYNRSASGKIDGEPLQLVQVAHRATGERWTERAELESDDLERLFWKKLRTHGEFVATHKVTCEWTDHPQQRSKILREPVGGLNAFRSYYRVREPLRMHTTCGNAIDEVEQYRAMRERPDSPRAIDGLKILLVGELAYNADRVLALEERGHKLYGLWMRDPYWYNTVGPLPFGHVEDLPSDRWREAIAEIQPDVIYAGLNWQAVPFAHEVLRANTGVPFVWHFKEGPFICREKGTWNELMSLYLESDGVIATSPEMREWLCTTQPELETRFWLDLDGDLPKRDWFQATFSRRISEVDGEIHTVVPGRPIGLHPHTVAELAQFGVHVHFYGDFTHGQWREWIDRATALAPRHLHLHANVDQARWVEEFSRYDAGWLHYFSSHNGGDLRRANWDDLNYPARMSTLAAAGLPMLQGDNSGHIVATQALARALDVGVFFRSMSELAEQLRDTQRMNGLRDRMLQHRDRFTFDHHADRLVQFFRDVRASSATAQKKKTARR